MNDFDEDDRIEMDCCYSVGSFGPFPVFIWKKSDGFYYEALEHDEVGPFDSADLAIKAGASDIGSSLGGFWRTDKEAESWAEKLRREGYAIGW